MTRTRLTAEERSEQVIQAAVTVFAASGYEAGRTDEIARIVGVSQPYVVRLFGTKLQLFMAATARVCDRIEQLFRDAAAQEANLDALGRAYSAFLAEPELPMLFLQGIAACANPAVSEHMRDRFGRIYDLVRDLTGATAEEASSFIATGMLLTIMSAIRVVGPDAIPVPWATDILTVCGVIGDIPPTT